MWGALVVNPSVGFRGGSASIWGFDAKVGRPGDEHSFVLLRRVFPIRGMGWISEQCPDPNTAGRRPFIFNRPALYVGPGLARSWFCVSHSLGRTKSFLGIIGGSFWFHDFSRT